MNRTRIAMAQPADINVDELRRRARRRLVGAVVLALGVAVVVPMLLETEQKPLGEDVSVRIPPIDSGKFVNRLNNSDAKADPNAAPDAGVATGAAPPVTADASGANGTAAAPAGSEAAPPRTQKYDTHVPDGSAAASASASATAPAVAATGSTDAVPATAPADTAPVIITDKGAGAPAQPPSRKPAPSESPKVASPSPHPGSDAAKAAHATAAASQREGFAVQLAAFADDRGANSLAGRLKKAGYAAYTEPLKTSKGTLWRVRVGPYPSREAAVAARDKLKTEGQSGIVAAIK